MAVSPHTLKPYDPKEADALETIIDNELSKESLELTDSLEFDIKGTASEATLQDLRQRYLKAGWKKVTMQAFLNEDNIHCIHLEFFS